MHSLRTGTRKSGWPQAWPFRMSRHANVLSSILLLLLFPILSNAFAPRRLRSASMLDRLFRSPSPARAERVSFGDLSVSPLGVGTWAWGNQFLWGYSTDADTELQEAFDYVLSKGITFYDSGDSYGTGRLEGRAETLLGKFIREHDYSEGSVRSTEDVYVATKIAPYPFRLGRNSIKKAMGGSSRRLDRGRFGVDIGQLHWAPPLGWQEQEYWAGLAELYKEGNIKAIGLSNYGPKKLRQAAETLRNKHGVPLASNQVQFSLVSTLPLENGMVETAADLGVRLIAYSPLGLGILTGKYNLEKQQLPQGPRSVLFKELLPALKPVLDTMGAIAAERTRKGSSKQPVTYSQVALNWCRAKGALPIVGIKTLAQAKEATGALDWKLSAAEMAALDQALRQMPKGKGQTVQNIFQTE